MLLWTFSHIIVLFCAVLLCFGWKIKVLEWIGVLSLLAACAATFQIMAMSFGHIPAENQATFAFAIRSLIVGSFGIAGLLAVATWLVVQRRAKGG